MAKKTINKQKDGSAIWPPDITITCTGDAESKGCGAILEKNEDGHSGHKKGCAWHKRVRESGQRFMEWAERSKAEIAEEKKEKARAAFAELAKRPPKEKVPVTDDVKTRLAEKGTCKHGHDLTKHGRVDSRGSIVCSECKREAAERHKAKKKGK